MMQNLGSDLYTDCTNLPRMYVSGNYVSKINTSSFVGLQHVEHLDLSNNNIDDLISLVFRKIFNHFTQRHSPNAQATKMWPKTRHHLSTSSPLSRLAVMLTLPSTPTFQLEYLDVSSNCVYSVDVELAIWLNRSRTHTDLTGNPWECECSGLGAWREEQRRETLLCALAKHVTEDRCNMLGRICPDIRAVASTLRPDSDNGSTTSVVTDSISTESAACSSTEEGNDTSLMAALFVVNSVLWFVQLLAENSLWCRDQRK